jgi:hypothetical protein
LLSTPILSFNKHLLVFLGGRDGGEKKQDYRLIDNRNHHYSYGCHTPSEISVIRRKANIQLCGSEFCQCQRIEPVAGQSNTGLCADAIVLGIAGSLQTQFAFFQQKKES